MNTFRGAAFSSRRLPDPGTGEAIDIQLCRLGKKRQGHAGRSMHNQAPGTVDSSAYDVIAYESKAAVIQRSTHRYAVTETISGVAVHYKLVFGCVAFQISLSVTDRDAQDETRDGSETLWRCSWYVRLDGALSLAVLSKKGRISVRMVRL